MSTQHKDVYLVIGGSGFVGRHIVEQLVARGDVVSVFDIVQRHHDVPFYSGDITDEQDVLNAIRKSGTTCIIHTASPQHGAKDPSIYYKVNVDGTQAVINAAVAAGVRKLVYTSSAGVVFDGKDVINLDERAPYPEKPFDAYNDSKAKGEALILEANGKGGLLTVALRPAGIFGPGDRQMMVGLYQVYQRGQTHFQVGGNNNLFDYTYVGNIAQAHLLAAEKLVDSTTSDSTSITSASTDATLVDSSLHASLHRSLPPISSTAGFRRVPTSKARPLGPYVTPPANAADIEGAFNAPFDPTKLTHVIVRNRFDQFSENALAVAPTSPLQVAGQAFFITNGEPVYFWDFMRIVWLALDPPTEEGRKRAQRTPWMIPRAFGMMLGYLAETWSALIGKEAGFTRYRVGYSCAMRYHNIEKARRVLGYEPEVGLEEGVRRMVESFKAENGLA
ncbi:3-beta hydroxysteroid dehydrogenase/isomerase family-domain-containing protein [Boletus reticuloceps]|uniref:3-beta hydroxysteroid dehydrogenase/isomerase family-domain-containing protein n=1 Tax=Boletus reticuloceps TaxID=495285 RepID=A0A8I2YIG2_9AGAM|nr:3-beta hydroxysteroid dehydrogenase/isomerase family-domain-containing protein [Boletus reticuloceps]